MVETWQTKHLKASALNSLPRARRPLPLAQRSHEDTIYSRLSLRRTDDILWRLQHSAEQALKQITANRIKKRAWHDSIDNVRGCIRVVLEIYKPKLELKLANIFAWICSVPQLGITEMESEVNLPSPKGTWVFTVWNYSRSESELSGKLKNAMKNAISCLRLENCHSCHLLSLLQAIVSSQTNLPDFVLKSNASSLRPFGDPEHFDISSFCRQQSIKQKMKKKPLPLCGFLWLQGLL